MGAAVLQPATHESPSRVFRESSLEGWDPLTAARGDLPHLAADFDEFMLHKIISNNHAVAWIVQVTRCHPSLSAGDCFYQRALLASLAPLATLNTNIVPQRLILARSKVQFHSIAVQLTLGKNRTSSLKSQQSFCSI